MLIVGRLIATHWPMEKFSQTNKNNQDFSGSASVKWIAKPNHRGKERFRETLVELSVETNSNYSGMRHKYTL